MYQVHYLNEISPKGTALWTDNYTVVPDLQNAQAALVRSASMHDMVLPEGLLTVARAGKMRGFMQEIRLPMQTRK